jgi:FMN phosphatase YigB (HAD superfamily)
MDACGIKLVCFDLGGVLVRLCRSWEHACRRAGLTYDPRVERDDLRVQRQALSMQLARGDMSNASYYEQVAALTDGVFTPEDCAAIHDVWIWEPYPGTEDLIDRLNRTDGLRTACLSNTDHEHWQVMRHVDEQNRPREGTGRFPGVAKLDFGHASHLFRAVKPDEPIYRQFEEAVGFRGPEILFFDDLPDNVATARRLGWNAHRIDPLGDTAVQIEQHAREQGLMVSA